LPDPIIADLGLAAEVAWNAFGKLFSRFHWTSLLAATLIAYAVWMWQRRNEPADTDPSFVRFLFPRKVWLHRSALLDYRFVLFDKVALGLLIGAGALILGPDQMAKVSQGGKWAIENAAQANLWVALAYTAVLLLTEDFFRYWAHRLMHASPLLWQFHKVHHSPEVLVPLSQLRTHPVNGLVNLVRSLIAIPLVTGIFVLLFPGELTVMSVLGINAGRFLFDVLGAQLRHSHVWLSWGPFMSRLVISPAQHQIHHSRAREHHNRNFGSQFALWDWMFGTLYVPQRREKLELGIGREETERMQSVASLYLEPFRDAWRVMQRRQARAVPPPPDNGKSPQPRASLSSRPQNC